MSVEDGSKHSREQSTGLVNVLIVQDSGEASISDMLVDIFEKVTDNKVLVIATLGPTD